MKCSFRWCEFDAAYVGMRKGHPHYACDYHYRGMTGRMPAGLVVSAAPVAYAPQQQALCDIDFRRMQSYTSAQRASMLRLREALAEHRHR